MRRYTIAIDGSDHEVDVEEVTANTFRVQIAGKSVDVRLRDHQDLSQAMITPEIEVAHGRTDAPVPSAVASVAPPSRPSTVPAPVAAPAPAAGGAGALTAPMPGVVLTISATVGQQVHRGDSLLVLEAMKMKNELKAAKDGVVAAINAEVGQQVNYGQVLVTFE